jgi:hypothetical protein
VTDQREQVAHAPDLQPQHAKAAVGIVEREALNEAGDLVERGR